MVLAFDDERRMAKEPGAFQSWSIATEELDRDDLASIAERLHTPFEPGTNSIVFPYDNKVLQIRDGTVTLIQKGVGTRGDFADQEFSLYKTQTVYDRDGAFHFVAPIQSPMGQPKKIEFFTIASGEISHRTIRLTSDTRIDPALVSAARVAKEIVVEENRRISEDIAMGRIKEKATVMP